MTNTHDDRDARGPALPEPLHDPVISAALDWAAWASESGDESYAAWRAARGLPPEPEEDEEPAGG